MPAYVSGAALCVLAALMLVAAGQPLFTDDAWLHLALGEAYATEGPWLERDPLLAVSLGPPTPAAWLFDVVMYGVHRVAGFTGLRLLHVLSVAAILALAARALRRSSGSWIAAHLGTAIFITLAAYRLVQLRPHLFTMFAVLLLCALAFEGGRALSPRRLTLVAVLCAVWANVHAAFLLGPILLATGAAGVCVVALLRGGPRRASELARGRSLVLASVVAGLATLLNPAGLRPHAAFFVAGSDTPALGRVADEWSPVALFSWPPADLPPSWLGWILLWGLVVATLAVSVWALASLRTEAVASGDAAVPTRDSGGDATRFDPALLAIAVLGCGLPLVAVRFLWLGVLPLIALLDVLRRTRSSALGGRAPRWALAVTTLLLVPGFVAIGPWPAISVGLPSRPAAYAQPYHAGKYHANLVWMLHDAGLEGTLFTDYHLAGFAGRHLAPRVRTLVNGTLNVPPDVIDANLPLRQRRGEREGERFVELLDRHGVDLFMGIRLPRASTSDRPWFHTTAHLERTEGWRTIFRNLNGALYLRVNERNRENLERVARFYEAQSVPFDPEVGFDVERVLVDDRAWAIRHGVVPLNYDRIAAAAYGTDPLKRDYARHQLASIYAVLGLYERALEVDELLLASGSGRARTLRRVAWCQLRLGRYEAAAETARLLEETASADAIDSSIVEAARRAAAMTDEEARASLLATLPLLTRPEAANLMLGVRGPSPRPEL